jgi:hypothetical protein
MKIPYSDARLSNGYNSAGADVKGSIGATDAWLGCFKERLRARRETQALYSCPAW